MNTPINPARVPFPQCARYGVFEAIIVALAREHGSIELTDRELSQWLPFTAARNWYLFSRRQLAKNPLVKIGRGEGQATVYTFVPPKE